ncbi:unnamed protein product [Lasius platythorax]|uniref:Uncharacterized protein n=1 Tax=Lasius platythorax TaxID=488582 RepID=A0AAV2MWR7_9HYME
MLQSLLIVKMIGGSVVGILSIVEVIVDEVGNDLPFFRRRQKTESVVHLSNLAPEFLKIRESTLRFGERDIGLGKLLKVD